jgi:hypothetical protein
MKTLSILVTGLIILIFPCKALNYYVSTDGSDQNNGQMQTPFASIQKGIDMLKAGDSLIIRGGKYKIIKGLTIQSHGLKDKWIVISNYAGENVDIDASACTETSSGIDLRHFVGTGAVTIEKTTFTKLRGITVSGSHNMGFKISEKETRHVDLIGCKSQGSYNSGIGLWYADSIRVLECEIIGANDQALRLKGIAMHREGPHEAISIAGARFFEVAYNQVHDCMKEGIDCKEVSAHGVIHHNKVYNMPRQGLYVDSWFGLLEDVEIFSNIVTKCEWGIGISSEGKGARMSNLSVHHNVLFDNRASGILFGVWGSDGNRSNIYIYNNTVVNNGSKGHWAGPTGGIDVRSSNLKDVFIYNNISTGNYAFDIATFISNSEVGVELAKKSIEISNNIIGQPKNITEAKGEFNLVYEYSGNCPIAADPMFVDSANADFRLKPESLARDNGKLNVPKAYYQYLGAIDPFLYSIDVSFLK